MKVSHVALAAALVIGGNVAIGIDSAEAQSVRENQRRRQQQQQQQQPQQQQQQQQGPMAQVTPEERAALTPLITAVQAQDWAAANAALPAAQAAAQSPHARYVVGLQQFEIGRAGENQALQAEGTEAMLDSGVAPAENLRPLLNNRTNFAIRAENWTRAEETLARLIELEPTNPERLWQLAEVKIRLNKHPEALTIYQRLIQLGEESGQRATQERYRRAYDLAMNTRNSAAATQLQAMLMRAYPTAENVGLGLVNLRRTATSDAALAIDIRRLMRASGAFTSGDEYVEFADRLNRAGLPGEARAVLQEGTSAGRIPASDSEARQMLATANARAAEDQRNLATMRTRAMAASGGRDARVAGDLFFGNGQYAEAAELYRAALQKGGEDANLVNSRLGAALALAGQRAEAETVLRAVTGPRAELANYWLLWLARPAG